ncbi:hypothetical protein Verru16b_03391 [Lacunisphaera limnophila]|uniref:Uncharacterized protein n=1 Tax=Lacunisphaera limnophila TaxID=1838286 RepID=A0A1D8AZH0_9BACT|nr:hypothetical protein [Lacunisphaera limnophila]AOS46290.1 hypothetical protein Verru16b_03391 [Lacunisphaera limnophila]
MSAARPTPAPTGYAGLTEVRYSLPDLLREVQLERDAPAFAMEKLEQVEIAKLFQKNRPRRAAKSVKP